MLKRGKKAEVEERGVNIVAPPAGFRAGKLIPGSRKALSW